MTNDKQKMTSDLNIINAQVPGYQGLQQIKIDEQGIITAISPRSGTIYQSQDTIDVAGDWVSLGGVDLQINGGLGLAFTDLSPADSDKLREICQYLWRQGVDAFLPTLVTTSVEKIQRSLAVIADFLFPPFTKGADFLLPPFTKGTDFLLPPFTKGTDFLLPPLTKGTDFLLPPLAKGGLGGVAKILGVHLEGPFLNPQKRGAHPAEHLLPLTIDNVKRVLGDYAHIVKVMTLAPELDSTGEVIPYLRSLGITVSLGHSQATATQAQKAFEQGASMVTHAFNAMPSLHHREPGLLGAALIHPGVQCGLIADGQHVSSTMIQLLLRAGCYEKGIFLVSDALAPIGLSDGVYPWDSRQIEVKNGTARLADGTLSGTTLPLLVGVQNLVKWEICGVEEAIALATVSPRLAIGITELYFGQSANLLRWHLNEATRELTWQRFWID